MQEMSRNPTCRCSRWCFPNRQRLMGNERGSVASGSLQIEPSGFRFPIGCTPLPRSSEHSLIFFFLLLLFSFLLSCRWGKKIRKELMGQPINVISKMTSCVLRGFSEAFVGLLPYIHSQFSTTAPIYLSALFLPCSLDPTRSPPLLFFLSTVSLPCCMPTQSSSSLRLPIHLRFGSLPSAALCSASLPLHPLYFLLPMNSS